MASSTHSEISMEPIEIPVIEVDIKYLYHTTHPNTPANAKYIEEILEDTPNFPIPEPGKYAGLHPGKYFSVSRWRDYTSPWLPYEDIFLRYQVKRPLKVFDLRLIHSGENSKDCTLYREETLHIKGIDGFLSSDEGFEVRLSNPVNVLIDNPKELEPLNLTLEERAHAVQEEKIKERYIKCITLISE